MKSLIKQVILFCGYIFHHNHKSKVIYYHDVSRKYTNMGTEYELMRKHFEIIKKQGYTFVPEIKESMNQVMVCFDDGWAGIYDYKDEFIKNNIFPTIFIAVSLIGKDGYLTESQIKELMGLGLRFQAHTWSHEDLTIFTDNQLEYELKESKEWLEKTFSTSFNSICFPLGRFSQHIVDLCSNYGYKKMFISIVGFVNLNDQLQNRNCVQSSSPKEFLWMLNGTSPIFQKRLEKQHIVK